MTGASSFHCSSLELLLMLRWANLDRLDITLRKNCWLGISMLFFLPWLTLGVGYPQKERIKLIRLDMVDHAIAKVKIMRESLQATQDWQKSYANVCQWELEF